MHIFQFYAGSNTQWNDQIAQYSTILPFIETLWDISGFVELVPHISQLSLTNVESDELWDFWVMCDISVGEFDMFWYRYEEQNAKN